MPGFHRDAGRITRRVPIGALLLLLVGLWMNSADQAQAAAAGPPPEQPSIEEEIERLEGEGPELTPEYMSEIDRALGEGEPAAAGDGGAHAAGASESGGHAPAPTIEVDLSESEPLAGFDLTVLRSGDRLGAMRYEFQDVRASVISPVPLMAHFSCALEFGRGTGVAEVAAKEELYRAMLTDLVGHMRADELLTVGGKIRLKQRAIRDFNRRLKTAQVRQIYLTEFKVVPAQ